ncbi:acyl--CoA ligase [Marinobacter halodurans]|uniref:acyl--CoA ligase n=1 Tax=Marinobacter halodurans TaxID=2528979 RepID=UPI0013F14CB1|nr:acyl--CoA ligase [Marinobacter halodurans]
MDIVKTSDLVAADLPNLESPFFAASKVRERIKKELEFGTSRLGRILSLPPSFTARREDHGRLLDEVEQKVRNGELWLVCSGQLIPDSILRFSSAATGGMPSLNV